MLSDEETQAIEYLKRHIIPYYGRKGTIEFMLNDTLLNLIEKQQKEIEELKRENKEIREWKCVIDNPIDLKKLSELDLIKIFGKSYIAVDKIKAKIEEVDENGYWEFLEKRDEEKCKDILHSLLEKE